MIARCAGTGDVAAAAGFAQDAGLEISVRGGAHNFGGAAVGDGGLTIDLSSLRQVLVSGTSTDKAAAFAEWVTVTAGLPAAPATPEEASAADIVAACTTSPTLPSTV